MKSNPNEISIEDYRRMVGDKAHLFAMKIKSLKGRPSNKENPVKDLCIVTQTHPGEIESCTITLVGLFPSLNKMLRMHWGARREKNLIMLQRLRALNIPKFSGKVSILLTFHHSILGDEDGLESRFKGIGDCLVKLGILVDDSPKYLSMEKPIQVKSRRKDQKLEITITKI